MKIGITAATGQLGKLVVESLKQKVASENIVVLVRTPEKASDLGVEAKAFDYSNKATQAEALKGIDTLLLISGSEVGQREVQHANVIASAKEAGVKKLFIQVFYMQILQP
jgi:NAD(P)H dehydrogenase (quinone)